MNCRYCRNLLQPGPRCVHCGAPAAKAASVYVRDDGDFHDPDRSIQMARRLADNRCPMDGCEHGLMTKECFFSECGGGHVFRKEDLFYLRPVTGVV